MNPSPNPSPDRTRTVEQLIDLTVDAEQKYRDNSVVLGLKESLKDRVLVALAVKNKGSMDKFFDMSAGKLSLDTKVKLQDSNIVRRQIMSAISSIISIEEARKDDAAMRSSQQVAAAQVGYARKGKRRGGSPDLHP